MRTKNSASVVVAAIVLAGASVLLGVGAQAAQRPTDFPATGLTTAQAFALQTGVDPAPAIALTSSAIAWRVEGIGAQPYLDNNLAAGPNGTMIRWPGTSVSSSSNAGRTWDTRLTVGDGIWGLDFLDASHGFVVGVNSLYATTDGGTTWRAVGEPGSNALVTVQFTSPLVGLGITTPGTVFATTDGGQSWNATNWPNNLGSACQSGASAYATSMDGTISYSADSGSSWTTVTSPSTLSGPIWSTTLCDSRGASVLKVALYGGAHGRYPAELVSGSSTSPNWTNNLDMPALSATTDVFDETGSSGAPIVISRDPNGPRFDVLQAGADGHLKQIGETTDSPISHPAATANTASQYLTFHGVASSGSAVAISLDDAGLGNTNNPKTSQETLASNDAGNSWAMASQEPPATPHPPASGRDPKGAPANAFAATARRAQSHQRSSDSRRATPRNVPYTSYYTGSDGSTILAATSQNLYVGQIGTYVYDYGLKPGPCPLYTPIDPAAVCFDSNGANRAYNRYHANLGLGNVFYYYSAGAASMYASIYTSPYCFGNSQGSTAYYDIQAYFSPWWNNQRQKIVVQDIESTKDGWVASAQAADAQVVLGFQKYIARSASADASCPYVAPVKSQPAVYSAPSAWTTGLGSTAVTQPMWTYQYCCTTSTPSGFGSGSTGAQWFGGGSYKLMWQYNIINSDLDIGYAGTVLPTLGTKFGD